MRHKKTEQRFHPKKIQSNEKTHWSKTNSDGQANGQETFDTHPSLMKQPVRSHTILIPLRISG